MVERANFNCVVSKGYASTGCLFFLFIFFIRVFRGQTLKTFVHEIHE